MASLLDSWPSRGGFNQSEAAYLANYSYPDLTVGFVFHVIHFIQTMTTSTLKSVKLVKGTSAWTLTRFSDSLFIARNTWGKKHVFQVRCRDDSLRRFPYEARLQGYGRSLSTLKRVA